jgi:hypothetical protein
MTDVCRKSKRWRKRWLPVECEVNAEAWHDQITWFVFGPFTALPLVGVCRCLDSQEQCEVSR